MGPSGGRGPQTAPSHASLLASSSRLQSEKEMPILFPTRPGLPDSPDTRKAGWRSAGPLRRHESTSHAVLAVEGGTAFGIVLPSAPMYLPGPTVSTSGIRRRLVVRLCFPSDREPNMRQRPYTHWLEPVGSSERRLWYSEWLVDDKGHPTSELARQLLTVFC